MRVCPLQRMDELSISFVQEGTHGIVLTGLQSAPVCRCYSWLQSSRKTFPDQRGKKRVKCFCLCPPYRIVFILCVDATVALGCRNTAYFYPIVVTQAISPTYNLPTTSGSSWEREVPFQPQGNKRCTKVLTRFLFNRHRQRENACTAKLCVVGKDGGSE